MKRTMKSFGPISFALLSFVFFEILYQPDLWSVDFITGLMVFSGALGSSAVIVFLKENRRLLLYLHLAVAFLFPILMVVFLEKFNPLWHSILMGIQFLGTAFALYYSIAYYQDQPDEKPGESMALV